MKFWQSFALTPVDEIIELAQVAEEVGFHGITLSDHLATPREIRTPYPYTADGKPSWQPHDPFPDPWVSIAAMAQETTRIRFMPFVYVMPMRDPFSVAKLLSSASVLSGERVVLGAGTGWMEEEFKLVQRDFRSRGRRTDEMFAVVAKLLSGETVDHAGEFYAFEGLHMTPCPKRPIEVRIGGLGPVSLRRAARHDGWLGLTHTPEEVSGIVAFLDAERETLGRRAKPFDVMISHYPSSAPTSVPKTVTKSASAAPDVQEYERYRDVGVDSVNVPPWRHRGSEPMGLDDKRRSLEVFAERYIVPLGS